MRPQTILRINPAVWIAPILVLLAVSYTNILPHSSDLYPLALTAKGTLPVFFVAPVCAACAAWEGGRLRRAGWWELPHVRSRFMVALASMGTALVVGILAIAAAVSVTFLGAGVTVAPDVRLIGMTAMIIATQALLGFAIGVHVRPVIAVPTVLLGIYGWMTLPRALQPSWLRHLNGSFLDFSVSTDVAPQALVGSLIMALGLVGSAVFLLRPHLDVRDRAQAVVPTVLAFVLGAFVVHGLGVDPIVPRDPSLLMCSSSQPRICVWPEHRARLEEVAAIASDAAARWRAAGIAVPDEFSERTSLALAQHSFGFSLAADRNTILNALAYSMLPPLPPCALEGASEPYLAGELVNVWLASVAGLPRSAMEYQYSPDVLNTVAKVRMLPVDQQRMWYERNLQASRECGVAPQVESHP